MTPDEARAMGEAAAKCVQIASMTRQELADYLRCHQGIRARVFAGRE
jgi:hypothetical protein